LIANQQQPHVSADKEASTGTDVPEKCKKENYVAGPAVLIPSSTVSAFYQTQAGGCKSHVLLVSYEKG